jgi:PAT family beta-lactamase induction signal transducer AmpG
VTPRDLIRDSSTRTRLAWIGAIAFASGFPFGLINETIPVYLRSEGAGLVQVGLVSSVTLPWTIKFLWAPLVDRVGSRRLWITACLALLSVLTLLVGHANVHALAPRFWLLLTVMVTLSATQDIAIDAYTIETTTERELGVANSVRIALYRVAMFIAGGLLIFIAGRSSWRLAFTVGAVLLAVLAAFGMALPTVTTATASHRSIWEPIQALFRRPGIGLVILFALIFKLDVALLEPMMRPFWVDRGLSLEEIGAVLTTGRIVATIAGAVLGGVLTTRWGIRTALWALGGVQAFSALGYFAAATFSVSKGAVYAAAFFENFAAGLGTAAFVAYLMSVAERRFAATQYALLSALMALTRSGAGAVSGRMAESLGYGPYFLVTFLLGLPAFALIPLLRRSARPDEVSVSSG